MKRITDPTVLRSFHRYGLGNPNKAPVCHGRQCGCSCKACLALGRQVRERGFDADGKLKPPPKPSQPWDSKAA